jgi:hypothetical protein
MIDPRLEAARALLERWDLDRVELAARLLETVGSAPEAEVLLVVARATRVVHELRLEAKAKTDGRISRAALELERCARAALEAAR